jgi:PIN domain nuclease of toxin-antitoxin system
MILLDTHVVIWLLTAPDRISMPAAQAIAETGADGKLPGVSTASLFELAYAKRRGRVHINVPDAVFLHRMRQWFDIRPVTDAIALQAAEFGDPFHGDPMDRMIAATAMTEQRMLVTADARILAAGVCPVLW